MLYTEVLILVDTGDNAACFFLQMSYIHACIYLIFLLEKFISLGLDISTFLYLQFFQVQKSRNSEN